MENILKNRFFFYFIGLAFFFALIHYYGFFSDASLYLLQVIHFLDPSRFENDVPYMFGNQDSFSIFSPVISVFFKLLGVNLGGIVATLIGQLLWCFASLLFFERWIEKFVGKEFILPVYMAFMVVFCAKQCYCGYIGFYFIEPLLVARFFSLSFVFLGLAFFLSNRKVVSLAFFFIASLFHPLMGGWGLALWIFFHFPQIRIPVVTVALLSPLSGFLHIGKLDFYPMDWLDRPLEYTPSLENSVNFAVLAAFWFSMWKRIENAIVSKFSLSMLAIVVLALYLQYIGTWTEHMLLYQVQPFRVWWIALMAAVPVFCVYIKERYDSDVLLEIRDYSIVLIAMTMFTNYQNPIILGMSVLLLALCFRSTKKVYLNRTLIKAIYGIGFIVVALEIALNNFIHYSLGEGVLYTSLAIKMINMPMYIEPVRMFVLLIMLVASLYQRKFWLAIAFGLAFCNNHLVILPLFAIVFGLFGNISVIVKKSLLSLAISVSFIELIGSADTNTEIGGWFIIFTFAFVSAFVALYEKCSLKMYAVLVLVSAVCLLLWDFAIWDNRSMERVNDEKQMDAFFYEPLFPQIKIRGRMLVVENQEFPLLSRFKFLSGNYGDESIYVGEVFYRGQFDEAKRRKKALFYGDTAQNIFYNYSEMVREIYSVRDTLLSRVKYLCAIDDISYFASDYKDYPLVKEDSVYLDVKKKYIYLYNCAENHSQKNEKNGKLYIKK